MKKIISFLPLLFISFVQIDNQSLQLNVIRKMQSIEKDKATSALRDYNEVKRDYCQTIKENEMIKAV